jgi:hypothetical protein
MKTLAIALILLGSGLQPDGVPLCGGVGGGVSDGQGAAATAAPGSPGGARDGQSPREAGWIARDEDHVCGLQVLEQVSSPARIDYDVVLEATEEYRQLRRDGIDPASARGQALTNAAKRRATSAARTHMESTGYCSVWKAIRHRDGRNVPDITEAVRRAL